MQTRLCKWIVSIAAAFLTVGSSRADTELGAGEARELAKRAYIYGFPLVDSYRIQHNYFVNRQSPEFKAPWNELKNIPRLYTPEDKSMQTPNSDTPYSMAGLDLRAEPMVLTVPAVDKDRYFSVQLIDAYTHNFAYLGSRTTGNTGGRFLIAGPGWNGPKPEGISQVIRSETDMVFALYRTQLFNANDLEQVKTIQTGYTMQPLSTFLGQPAPQAAPGISYLKPLPAEAQKTSPEFFGILNFVLQFCPTVPSEKSLMDDFAKIGIGAGKGFDIESLSAERREAIRLGMEDAWKEFATFKKEQIDTGKVVSGDLFGTRDYLKNNYLYRMAGAVLGIYGNSREEAMYPAFFVDSAGQKLDGANRYRLRFAPGQLPPVDAFWSLTLYELPSSLLAANPLNRYLLNSPMLPKFKRDGDGGLTLLIQNDSPGAELEANWLPAPKGPFFLILRLYRPKEEVVSGAWKAPLLEKESQGVAVTRENYCRAESDRTFFNITKMADGVNRFFHFRNVTPLDQQTVIRMNKDTLYSGAVVDTAKGATITVPEVKDGRYFSVLLIDNDHYCPGVIYQPGTHKLPGDTKYLLVVLRIQLLKPEDPADVAAVNRLQDQFLLKTGSADPFAEPQWDKRSLEMLTADYNRESAQYSRYPNGWMGPRGLVDEKTRHLGCAGAWGLFPNKDAVYINYNGQHPKGQAFRATYTVPENNAFWSITVYGADGYMKSTNSVLNRFNTRFNPDGTFTVHFGTKEQCGDVANRLDAPEGWNFLMRIYRPGASVLDGTYQLPKAEPVQ